MKLELQRNEALTPLTLVTSVVERRQTLPILANVRLELSSGELKMTGTDLEVEIEIAVEAKGDTEGTTTVNARKFLDICRALPEGATLKIEQNADRLKISSGRSRFSLQTLSAEDFPRLEEGSHWEERIKIRQGALKTLLEKTAFSMAQQDVRYYLNGLLLEVAEKTIKAVATDGHRLAFDETDIKKSSEETRQIIVPRKGVTELIRLLQTSQDDANIRISKNHIQITSGNLSFTSKLIDGKFPDYQRVIPEISETVVTANREDLKNSLARASILSNEKYRGVKVAFSKDSLRILAHNPEKEEAEEEVSVVYQGEEMEIGFNVSYLIDALSAIKTEKVVLSVLNPNSSCLIIPEQKAQCQYVVMPMKL